MLGPKFVKKAQKGRTTHRRNLGRSLRVAACGANARPVRGLPPPVTRTGSDVVTKYCTILKIYLKKAVRGSDVVTK